MKMGIKVGKKRREKEECKQGEQGRDERGREQEVEPKGGARVWREERR